MATVKDGMKIALGWLLFKWIVGGTGCLATLGVVTCLMYSGNKEKASPPVESTVEAPRRSGPHTASGQTIRFDKGCNLREEPSAAANKVGFATAGRQYSVLERRGQWRKISLPDGTEGWAGCRAGGTRAIRQPTDDEDPTEDL